LAILVAFSLLAFSAPAEQENPSASPRKLYNDGTQRLHDGKLQEAEACLQGAVATQEARVQGPALYNLGEVRFKVGAQELKKAQDHQAVSGRSQQASDGANGAVEAIDKALLTDDVQAMVEAYWRGRGARKDLKGAMDAVKTAMEKYGVVLEKWQRASGDFKSDYELVPNDSDAKTNADMVDREIAKLVDKQQMMMKMMGMMAQQKSDLNKRLADLKKKIPGQEGDKLKGKGDDDEDDDDNGRKDPKDLKDGWKNPSNRTARK
jgi:hypothetical protein